MDTRTVIFWGILWFVVGTPMAVAQPNHSSTPSAKHQTPNPQSDKAREFAKRAKAAYENGHYVQAIQQYQQAYEFDSHPVLQFNLARAYEANGNLPSARDCYAKLTNSNLAEIQNIARRRLDSIIQSLGEMGFDPRSVSTREFQQKTTINIHSKPAHVDIYLNGFHLGKTPLQKHPIASGKQELFFTATGYLPILKNVKISKEAPTDISVELIPKDSTTEYVPPPPGRLRIQGPTNGMNIYLNGSNTRKTTPLSGYVLPAGSYTITVSHPLYNTSNQTVRIEPGQLSSLDFSIKMAQVRRRPLLQSHQKVGLGLIGGGSAALIVGGAVGGASISHHNRADSLPAGDSRDALRTQADREGISAKVLVPVGIAAITTGIVLRLIRKNPSSTEGKFRREDLFRVTFSPQRKGAGILLRSTF